MHVFFFQGCVLLYIPAAPVLPYIQTGALTVSLYGMEESASGPSLLQHDYRPLRRFARTKAYTKVYCT